MARTNQTSEAYFCKAHAFSANSGAAKFPMIVLDAPIVVELLINGRLADPFRRDLSGRVDLLIVLHLLDIEVASGVRKLSSTETIDPPRAAQIFDGLVSLPVPGYAHTPLLDRIWELRHNFTCYDAAYIALAEATDSVLYTSDKKLRDGHRTRVRLFDR